ncbi:MAG: hypothetical protein SFU98_04660 [Leptospiraceae bacterium]|nr:hypothetical protein [Leptospiraceae bacterium]
MKVFLFFLILNFSLNHCKSDKSIGLKFLFPIGTISQSLKSFDISEGGVYASYKLSLPSKPNGTITITLTTDSQITIDKNLVVFTETDWTEKEILVTATDDGKIEGTHSGTLRHSVSSTDIGFLLTSIPDVVATINDNDARTPLNRSIIIGTTISNSTLQSIPITTVDISKAFVYCNFGYTLSSSNNSTTCQLNSSGTGVEIQSGGGNATVNWYVIEFSSGSAIQRGSITLDSSTTTTNVTINPVTLTQTFVLVYSRITNFGNGVDERRTIMARLSTNTNLEISRNEANESVIVEWQVVQLSSVFIQSGQLTLSSLSQTVAIT